MILLASKSPRRAEILTQLGLQFRVIHVDTDETTCLSDPESIVIDISRRKAKAALSFAGHADIILSADTIVTVNGQILGKPVDKKDAKKMLMLLSGKEHQVYTGVTLGKDNHFDSFCDMTKVIFRELTESEIDDYIATGEPMDKAGAYGIQGKGMRFVKSISGDFYNVMGLPGVKVWEKVSALSMQR